MLLLSPHRTPLSAGLATALLLVAAPAFGASLTGVCPDGSMFIVKHASDIPCDRAKLVDANDMPPIKPQFLPRPYGWEKFHREKDPNNPYNLVTDMRESPVPDAPLPTPAVSSPPPQQKAALAPPVEAPRAPRAPSLQLSDEEIRSLSLIVEMSQSVAPAALRSSANGDPSLVLEFAHSVAFEARLRDGFGAAAGLARGPVLLFAVRAEKPDAFWANLTFVQGHVAFHPDRADPKQLGVLRGRLGPLESGDGVLGYAVLPERIDLSASLDIYWNDRQLTARLQR